MIVTTAFLIVLALVINYFHKKAMDNEGESMISPIRGVMIGFLQNRDHISDIDPTSDEDYYEVTVQICLFIINFTFIWNED